MTEYAIDYAFARPVPEDIKAAGYTGVLRYLAPVNNATRGKLATKTEVDALRRAGLDVTLNFEWYETRPTKGYQAGVDDARVANEQAAAIGYPLTCAIYFSVDFGASWPAVREYFRGVAMASKYPVGVYGGLTIIAAAFSEHMARFGWVTNAASWSGQSRWSALEPLARAYGCHLLQHLHSNTPFHVRGVPDAAFDPNTILVADYGQWRAHPVPPVDPAPEEEDVSASFWHGGFRHRVWEAEHDDPDHDVDKGDVLHLYGPPTDAHPTGSVENMTRRYAKGLGPQVPGRAEFAIRPNTYGLIIDGTTIDEAGAVTSWTWSNDGGTWTWRAVPYFPFHG